MPPLSPPTDDDHARFIALLLQSEREVLRYVLALVPNLTEAREIVQNTAIELWRKFSDYDSTRPFTPWACRFALRQVQSHLRRNQRWRVLLDDTLVDTLAEERSQLDEVMERRFSHLDHCLEKLPAAQREMIHLYYHEEKTLPEISSRLGRSVDGLYKALQRTRRLLLQCLTSAENGGQTSA